MGGAQGVGNKTPAGQFNILIDPQSYEYLLHEEGLEIAFAPLQVTHTCMANEKIQSKIQALDSPFA